MTTPNTDHDDDMTPGLIQFWMETGEPLINDDESRYEEAPPPGFEQPEPLLWDDRMM